MTPSAMITALPTEVNSTSIATEINQPTIALLHCYDLIDDFLDSINISWTDFCQEFVGSWMFGYINALKLAGVRTVLFCVTNQVKEPTRFIHQPTNTTICALPPSKIYRGYRAVRRQSLNAYGASEGQSFKDIEDSNNLRRSLLTPFKDLARSVGAYLATPLGVLAEELRRENCQAILCQEYEYARFDACVMLGKLIKVPVFASFQGGDALQSWLEYPGRRLALKACQGVIIGTATERKRVSNSYHLPSHKIASIFNPLEVAQWKPGSRKNARFQLRIPVQAKVVAWHGRVEMERKGLDILLQAWQKICLGRPQQDLRLLLVGTGSDAQQLRQRIQQMNLRGVQWLNEFVSDRSLIERYLMAADVYAFPSRQEGFPLAPIEAMSCGLPVVATAAPGVPDILAGGENSGGLMVPRGNVAAFTYALAKVLDSPQWAKKLGHKARYRAHSCFAPQAIGEQLREFLFQ